MAVPSGRARCRSKCLTTRPTPRLTAKPAISAGPIARCSPTPSRPAPASWREAASCARVVRPDEPRRVDGANPFRLLSHSRNYRGKRTIAWTRSRSTARISMKQCNVMKPFWAANRSRNAKPATVTVSALSSSAARRNPADRIGQRERHQSLWLCRRRYGPSGRRIEGQERRNPPRDPR